MQVALLLFLVGVSTPSGWAQTSDQNWAAFRAAADLTRQSYHWDSLGGDPASPQVATTPRTPLGFAPSLTTLGWDPTRTDLYQSRTINGVEYSCVRVATFTRPNNLWDRAPGTAVALTYQINDTTHLISPWVTSGNDLKSYLQQHYFPTGEIQAPDTVALRVQQSLGMTPVDASGRGIAYFWVPIQQVARPAYSGDPTTPMPVLSTYSDGSYRTTGAGSPIGFTYVDPGDDTRTVPSLGDYIAWNQAVTTYPWTAMGYTFNWNALQDGSQNYGNDSLRVSSPVGVTEFIVSGGTTVILDSWVPYSQFGSWVVPEPATWLLTVAGGFLLLAFRVSASPRHRSQDRRGNS
ncbi:MAG: hypothetical protein ACO3I0_02025 [Limisphaerales bacterium]